MIRMVEQYNMQDRGEKIKENPKIREWDRIFMFLKIAQGMPSFKMFFFSNFTGVWYPKF